MNDTVRVKLWGDMACFTRPEFKGERVSYPVPTPSAMRGALSAIFWKPQFDWVIQSIEILKPIKFTTFGTSEVKSKASLASARKGGRLYSHLETERTRRHNRILRDVAYIVTASVRVRPGCHNPPSKYVEQFNRRVERGECFNAPLLGSKCPAYFDLPGPEDKPHPINQEVGAMFFDHKYGQTPKTAPVPAFFNCEIKEGVVKIPQGIYDFLLADYVSPPYKEVAL